MKRFNDNFPDILEGFEFDTLEQSKSSIYGVSKDLKLIYFNQGWIDFARSNDPESKTLNTFTLGTPLMDGILGKAAQEFYLENYRKVLATGERWRNEYECSSTEEERHFQQEVYPLKNGSGLLIINRLKVSAPMSESDRTAHAAIEAKYRDINGFITQCSNCRNTLRSDESEIWDWVPEWVDELLPKTSHSICPICFDYHWKNAALNFSKNLSS